VAHEQAALEAGRDAGVRTVVVRPGIVYGARAGSSATCSRR
jgi:nucleoside-diphosphate-sugar epimerase